MKGYASVDVETTGLYDKDRVIEVAVVCTDAAGQVVEQFETLIDPQRDVGPTQIHRVTAAMVSAAPLFADVAGSLAALLDGRVLVAHNAAFDERFLINEFERCDLAFEGGRPVCTLSATRAALPVACEERGIRGASHRSALAKALVTLELLQQIDLPVDVSPMRVIGEAPAVARRTLRRPASASSAAGDLQRVIERLRYSDSSSVAEITYLDALDRALDDGFVDEGEDDALTEIAARLGLSYDDRVLAHESYLDAVIDAVERDGIVTSDEDRLLRTISTALGLKRPLPEVTPEIRVSSLAAGSTVCFTGSAISPNGQHMTKSDLGELARSLDLQPMSSVTKKLDLLVAADASSASGKAKKARAYGIPVISIDEFLELGS